MSNVPLPEYYTLDGRQRKKWNIVKTIVIPWLPGFWRSKYDTDFGSFFSATYNKKRSEADQARQLNWAAKKEKSRQNQLSFEWKKFQYY